MHFGSLVAALASYADARHAGGEWIVRIEDVDLARSDRASEASILRSLARHGFHSDAPIVRQSQRVALYAETLERLRATGKVYECACSRRDLEGTPVSAIGERVYAGTCREGIPAERAQRSQRAWRMRVQDAAVSYTDRLQGPQVQDLGRDVGDFVVRRADGLYAYQLAVVVDDALQGITHVVRGADLLSSTPRQILLQRALAFGTPAYLHVPVAVDARGHKLSKQTRARALDDDAPLASLQAAWRFLQQDPCPPALANVDQFWRYAAQAWNVARLPPTLLLPVSRVHALGGKAPSGSTV